MALFQNVTVRKIAELSGVSIATVSRAINGTGPVKPATLERIQKAMRELSSRPVAGSLASRTILASFPNLSNPFNTNIIKGMSDAAARHGYDMIYSANENYSSPLGYQFFEHSDFFSGIIIAHNVPNEDILTSLSEKVPVVMCSEHISGCKIPYVAIDDYAAAYSAVNYLVTLGRKKIALVNTSTTNNYAVHRERGFRACLENSGIPVNEQWVLHLSDVNFDLAVASVASMFQSDVRPDACFCVSDLFAAAVIKTAAENDVSVPKDLSVVGFDDIDLATITSPSITTIHQPTYQLGFQSCNLLIEQIETSSVLKKPIILNTDLIVRAST